MPSGLMPGSYALDAVPGTDRGGAGSGRCPSINASVTLPFPSAPRPSEQAPLDAHSVRMCGVSRGSYMLRRGCACGSGDGSAPERVPGVGRSERERNSRYGVAQAMVVKVRMRLRKPIFVCVILKGSSSLPMCGKDQVA